MGEKEQELIGIDEAARMLGVSTMTLRRWVKKGEVPFFKPGRKYRFSKDELKRFLEHHHEKGIIK